jgi:hypothetical protein
MSVKEELGHSLSCVIRSGLVKCSAGDVSIVGAH